jgi:zinc transport system permease protein
MSGFLHALSTQTFLQYAVIGGLITSVICGVMGPIVVVRKLGYITGGIAHTVLGGMGLAFFLGLPPMSGALVSAVLASMIVAWFGLYSPEKQNEVISALWSAGMALGVLLIHITPGYQVDLVSYLFGNILLISPEELFLIAILGLLTCLSVAVFFKQFVAISFDSEYARLQGVAVNAFTYFLMILIALTVVALIKMLGIVLAIAMLAIPAAISLEGASSLSVAMVRSIGLGVIFTLTGLWLAFEYNLPAGASTVVVAASVYLVVVFIRQWRVMGR